MRDNLRNGSDNQRLIFFSQQARIIACFTLKGFKMTRKALTRDNIRNESDNLRVAVTVDSLLACLIVIIIINTSKNNSNPIFESV